MKANKKPTQEEPKSNFREKILSLFRSQNGSPFFHAKGLAIGVFSGCFPFFGFQTLMGVFFAKIAKGNIVLAAIGTWISNPFTYIPLYYFNSVSYTHLTLPTKA